jgi:hypothetical protein
MVIYTRWSLVLDPPSLDVQRLQCMLWLHARTQPPRVAQCRCGYRGGSPIILQSRHSGYPVLLVRRCHTGSCALLVQPRLPHSLTLHRDIYGIGSNTRVDACTCRPCPCGRRIQNRWCHVKRVYTVAVSQNIALKESPQRRCVVFSVTVLVSQ